MLEAAIRAARQIVSPPFRAVLWRSLVLTLALLAVFWFALFALAGSLLVLPFPWMETVLALFAGLGVIVASMFLIGPVTSLVAGFFLDEIAAHVETADYPADAPGSELPLVRSLVLSLRFFGLVVLVNLFALVLLLVPGINVVAFLFANGYLLGREYFELVAFRHLDADAARALRRRHSLRVFLAGLMIAGLLAVPVVNLLTPLFATALMVHLFKKTVPGPAAAARG